jgi:hypothetical protein
LSWRAYLNAHSEERFSRASPATTAKPLHRR